MSTLDVFWIAHYTGDPDTVLFVGGSGPRSDDGIRADANNRGNAANVLIMDNFGVSTTIEVVDGTDYIFAPPLS
jgi:hypothetical protein